MIVRPAWFDFKRPDYVRVFNERIERLKWLREDARRAPMVLAHYRENPGQLIMDWGCTHDPRNVAKGLPAVIPFIMFDKQIEWVEWVLDHWRAGRMGLTEKSRDMGISWLAVGLGCALGITRHDIVVGYGSRKEEYVDKLDSPKALFYKARMFMRLLPEEFRAGNRGDKDSPHMRIKFPHTGSVLTGEAGDNIGRGDRTALHFVDEAAHLERPALVDASLSATTNCRMDLSSVNGMANPFAEKRHSGKVDVFTFGWRDDPRKDEEWYERQKLELSAVVVAQEIDISYSASVEGVLIPQEWVQAAVGALAKLGLTATGEKRGAMDVADGGADKNAFSYAHGVELQYLDEWSGKGSDIAYSVEKAHATCGQLGIGAYRYDGDGLGAGVKGDARMLNERDGTRYDAQLFRGSGAVIDPDEEIPTVTEDTDPDRTVRLNKDYFYNAKAQAWFALRMRFQLTYRWVVEGKPCDPDRIISINPYLPLLQKLCTELSQPTFGENPAGKMLINKQPEDTKSPNLADSVMILFAPREVRSSIFDM